MRPFLTVVFSLSICAGCGGTATPSVTGPSPTPSSTPAPAPQPPIDGIAAYDVARLGVPQFVTANYIDLAPIRRISKFRSGEGHSYTDNFEACRSMKHYFQTPLDSSASGVRIFAPVTGVVIRMDPEWAGTQIHIRPDDQPAFWIILFHVTAEGLEVGQRVQAGQAIGHHVGSQTASDVAVAVNTPEGFALVSWFDTITEQVFDAYRARGLMSRGDAIIARDARDTFPLACSGETFTNKGTLENWITLR